MKKVDGKVHLLDDVYDKLKQVEDQNIERALAKLVIEKQKTKEKDEKKKVWAPSLYSS